MTERETLTNPIHLRCLLNNSFEISTFEISPLDPAYPIHLNTFKLIVTSSFELFTFSPFVLLRHRRKKKLSCCLSVCLFICPFVRLSICLLVCLSSTPYRIVLLLVLFSFTPSSFTHWLLGPWQPTIFLEIASTFVPPRFYHNYRFYSTLFVALHTHTHTLARPYKSLKKPAKPELGAWLWNASQNKTFLAKRKSITNLKINSKFILLDNRTKTDF